MRVKIANSPDDKGEDVLKVGSREAELIPYVNNITGKSDPMLLFAPARFIHLSSVKIGRVYNVETGEEVIVE